MAIYHLSAQALSRSSGSSAVAAAAYRAGERLHDERTGETHDYAPRGDVDRAEIIAPDDAPDWTRDRERLWNAAEAAERRRNSQVAREVRVAIPSELSEAEGRELVREFTREQFTKRGMVADVAFHEGRGENPHAHVMLTMRRLEGEGFAAKKERAWNAKEQLQEWREAWARDANRALDRAGLDERIDHRTLTAQRDEALARGDAKTAEQLDREPQLHLGKAGHVESGGEVTERGNRFVAIEERNEERTATRRRAAIIQQIERQLAAIRRMGRRLQELTDRLQGRARELGLPAIQQRREAAAQQRVQRRHDRPAPGMGR